MKTNYEIRYAAHPEDARHYDTARLRRDFLIENLFVSEEVNMVYSMYDRMVVGGAMPVSEALKLEAIDPLKADFFTTRREVGIYNVGGSGPLSWVIRKHFISGVATVMSSSAVRMPKSQPSSISTPPLPIQPIPAVRLRNRMLLWHTWEALRCRTSATSIR